MTGEWAHLWGLALQGLSVLVVPLGFAYVRDRVGLSKRLTDLDRRLLRNEGRLHEEVTVLRTLLEGAPTGASYERLTGEVKAMRARLDGLEKFLTRMDAVLTRQEDYLLRRE